MDWDQYKRLRNDYMRQTGRQNRGVLPEAAQHRRSERQRIEIDNARRALQKASHEARSASLDWKNCLLTGFGDREAPGLQQLVAMKRARHRRLTAKRLARDMNRRYLMAIEVPFFRAHFSFKIDRPEDALITPEGREARFPNRPVVPFPKEEGTTGSLVDHFLRTYPKIPR